MIDFRISMAICNVITIILLVVGLIAIKKENKALHKKMMISGIFASALLVVFYLLQAYFHGPIRHTDSEGLFKFALITHIFLAIIIPFLVLRTAYLAIKGRFETHKKWAKITLPIWIYVSATGIWIYLA